MTTMKESVTPKKILELAQSLSADDLTWLIEQLHRLTDDFSLPTKATLDDAIDFYLKEQCSLGKAAELAGITRWQLQNELYMRGTPASLGSDLTLAEIDDMVDIIEAHYGSGQ